MKPISVPILNATEAAAWETHLWSDDPAQLKPIFARVGEAIVETINRIETHEVGMASATRLLLVGKGHNGADALYAARALLSEDPEVQLSILVAEPDALKPLTAEIKAEVAELGETRITWLSVADLPALTGKPIAWILDGLLGFGGQGPLREPYVEILDWVAAQEFNVQARIALDVPSGLNSEGGPVFRADFTLAMGAVKSVLLQPSAVASAGRIRWVDLGMFDDGEPETVAEPRRWLTDATLAPLRRYRPAASDKRDYGHVFVLAGSDTMPGAALLTTKAALTAGAGLATLAMPNTMGFRVASNLPEAMLAPYPLTPAGSFASDFPKIIRLASTKATAMVIGPGLQLDRTSVFSLCRVVRENTLPMVIDASALLQDVMSAVMSRPKEAGPVIITPHLGEFARITGRDPNEDLHAFAPEFAHKFACVVLLKGPISTITDGTQTRSFAAGGPTLARGGSGDILAGLIGARLALPGADALTAACEALVWQGAAAVGEDPITEHAQRASSLIDALDLGLRYGF